MDRRPTIASGMVLAALLFALPFQGTARAADLPPEPLGVSYVGTCSAAGEGYYVVPGTTTCIHVYGLVRAEYQGLLATGDVPVPYRNLPSMNWLARGYIHLDSYTETEFGALTTAFKAYWTNDQFQRNSAPSVDYAQIDFAGFTFGRTQSFYDAANYLTWADVFTPGQSDLKTQVAAYTASLPGGLSLTASVEAAGERRLGIANYPYSGTPPPASVTPRDVGYGPADGYGGEKWPDAVARLKVVRSWGSAQVMGAAHQVYAAYNDTPGSDGVTPGGGLGWAAGMGLTTRLPHAMSFVLTGTYAVGAAAYANSSWYAQLFHGPLAFDAAYDPATGDLDLSTTYSISAGLGVDIRNANIAVQGAWSRFENETLGQISGGAASANFTQYDLQAALTYTVVKDLTFGVAGEYQYLDHEDASIATEEHLAMLFRVERAF